MGEDPVWFHLGIVAPRGWVPPGGPARVFSRLLSLVRHREHRREKIGLTGVCSQPITAGTDDLFRRRGWHFSFHAHHPDKRPAIAHRAACAQVAVGVHALAIFHSGPLDRDMADLTAWCDWIGVAWRVIRIDPDPEPV